MNIFVLTATQKRFFRTGAVFCLALFLLTVPMLVLAEDQTKGLVPCDGPATVAKTADRVCNFQALLRGINEIINWMFIIAIPLSLVSFTYAGILFMSGKEGNITQGKEIFGKVVWGIVIMSAGWLVVHTIIRGLLDPNAGFGGYLFGL